MKKTLVFSIVWTVLAAIGTIAIWHDPKFGQEAPNVRRVLTALPIFGAGFVWWSWRRYRRYQSVRTQETELGTLYVWTDLDGTTKKSEIDPRIKWDEDDRLHDE
ncbi:MAG: hypothetical protein AAFQ84_04960 [Pseudomonadota bacterium]